jgi:hypothetical protein
MRSTTRYINPIYVNLMEDLKINDFDEENLYIVDCPGMEDSEGVAVDIAC